MRYTGCPSSLHDECEVQPQLLYARQKSRSCIHTWNIIECLERWTVQNAGKCPTTAKIFVPHGKSWSLNSEFWLKAQKQKLVRMRSTNLAKKTTEKDWRIKHSYHGWKNPRFLEKKNIFLKFLDFNVRKRDTKLWPRNLRRISYTYMIHTSSCHIIYSHNMWR